MEAAGLVRACSCCSHRSLSWRWFSSAAFPQVPPRRTALMLAMMAVQLNASLPPACPADVRLASVLAAAAQLGRKTFRRQP